MVWESTLQTYARAHTHTMGHTLAACVYVEQTQLLPLLPQKQWWHSSFCKLKAICQAASLCSSQHLVYWLSMLCGCAVNDFRAKFAAEKIAAHPGHKQSFVVVRVNDLCFLAAYDSNNNTFCSGRSWVQPILWISLNILSMFLCLRHAISGLLENQTAFLRSGGRAVGIEWMTWHFWGINWRRIGLDPLTCRNRAGDGEMTLHWHS